MDLPWASAAFFRIWSYAVGQSQLILSSRAGLTATDYFELRFEAVEFMQLRRSYRGLGLTLAGDGAAPPAGIDLAGIPLLRIVISSDSGPGLVLCGRATGHQHHRQGEDVLFAVDAPPG